MGLAPWQQWCKQPNLSQQIIVYEVTCHPVHTWSLLQLTAAASDVCGGATAAAAAGDSAMVGPVETEEAMGSCDHGDLGAGGGMLVSGRVVAGVPS